MFASCIALCGSSIYAQEPRILQWYGPEPVNPEPAQEEPDGLQKIFSSLGPPTSPFSLGGYSLNGPATGGTEFLAMAFKPTAAAHVLAVRVALQYISGPDNQVNLSLYSDANGVPGALLAGPVTVSNLPTYGSCCQLALAAFNKGVAVSAGIQYWVVGDTPLSGKGSDFGGIWNSVYSPLRNAFSHGNGWLSYRAVTSEPAGAVYGTIP